MAETKQVLIPDIGDFQDVPVIEVLVKSGDSVRVEDPLIVLESDKATIEVPSPFAGVVGEISVKVGDKVSEGTLILVMQVSETGNATPAPQPASAPQLASQFQPSPPQRSDSEADSVTGASRSE